MEWYYLDMGDLPNNNVKGFGPRLLESEKGTYLWRLACLVIGSAAAMVGEVLWRRTGHASVWDGLFLIPSGLFVLFHYGLTKEPLYFNELIFRRKPLPVWAARLTYIPLGLYLIYIGIECLISALK